MTSTPPPAGGLRLPWWDVPAAIRAEVDSKLGSPVVRAENQPRGFSPGAASRLTLADGRRVFAKAVGPEPNERSPVFHRREGRIAASLPAGISAPRLLEVVDDGAWVALVFEEVPGVHPQLPWMPEELAIVLAACAATSAALDPSPVAAPSLADSLDQELRGWEQLAGGDADADLSWLDPWTAARIERLAARERDWADAAAGTALVHSDLRADNILLVHDRVVFVDWPHASIGAGWFDVVGMGPSVIMHTGPEVFDVLDRHLAERGAPADSVDAVLAAICGYFVRNGSRPAPPGLPTIPTFQRAQGAAGLTWLRHRAPDL